MVASLPSNGAKPLIWLARAARTCWETSWQRSRTQGTIRARTTSFSSSFENPVRGVTGWSEIILIVGHTWNLACSRRPYLRLVVLEKLHEVPDELLTNKLRPDNLSKLGNVSLSHATCKKRGTTCLVEVARRHVPNSPALVGHRLPNLLQQLILNLRGREPLCDRDEVLHGEEANGVLVVALKLPVDYQAVT